MELLGAGRADVKHLRDEADVIQRIRYVWKGVAIVKGVGALTG